MKIFKPSDATHTLEVIPSEYVTTATMTIRDKHKNTSQDIELECETVQGYLTSEFNYTFREAAQYEITLKNSDGEQIYYGAIFATNTTDLQNYKMTA